MIKITKQLKETVKKNGLYVPTSMLSVGKDAKTIKGVKKNYLTGIMYLHPSVKLCPSSIKAGCIEACLNTAGRSSVFPRILQARHNKTNLLEKHEELALTLIYNDIQRIVNKANTNGMNPAIRLNGTSDIDWTTKKLNGKTMFEHFPDVQFYDYTKNSSIARKSRYIPNYHVTGSYSNEKAYRPSMIKMIGHGVNIAVVFRGKIPETFMGKVVVNGDETDLRFLDKSNVIVALKAKGNARTSKSNFVVDTNIIASA